MIFNNQPYSLDRACRLLVNVLIIVGIIWLMNYLSDILIPFAVAFLLAYLLNPLVNMFQSRVRYRSIAVFSALVLAIGVILMTGWIVIPVVKQEISHISGLMSRVAKDTTLSQSAAQYLPPWLWGKILEFAKDKSAQNMISLLSRDDIITLAQAAGEKVLPGAWKVIHGAASFVFGLVGLFIILIYLFFMLLDYQRVKDDWQALIPPVVRKDVLEFFTEFNDGMKKYFRAQACIAFIVGALFAAGFWMIGLPLGILLGLFIGILNMVPYLQLVGLVPAGLLAIIMAVETGGSPLTALGLTLLVFVIVQVVQDTFLTPKIMGRTTGLSPVMILLSISVWGKLLGLLGIIIAIPITCLLLAYYRRLMASSNQNRNSHNEEAS
jgi:predicted PurR-regulated permease PerM